MTFSMQEWLKEFFQSKAYEDFNEFRRQLVIGSTERLRKRVVNLGEQLDQEYEKGVADTLDRDLFKELQDYLQLKQEQEKGAKQ